MTALDLQSLKSKALNRRVVIAVLLAALCAGVAATRVDDRVERLRYRVVTSPRVPDGAALSIPLPDLSRFLGQPAALILRFRGGAQAANVTVLLDGATVAQIEVPVGGQIRFDGSIVPPSGPGHRLTFAGDRPGWSLGYLEIATVHGHSTGLLSFAIVPRARAGSGGAASAWVFAVVFVGLLALRRRIDWPLRRVAWRFYHSFAAVVALLLAMTLASGIFTNYRLLLSTGTFLLLAAVLYAEPIARGWRSASRGLWLERASGEAPPLPSWREAALAFAGFSLLIAGVLHVQIVRMYSVPDLGDPLFSMWRMAWVVHQLGADPRHLFDANIFYPARGTLTYSDAIILPALMQAPLRWVGVHPVVAYNLLLLSALVLSGLTTYVLARGLGFGVAAAWTSGAMFALYPFRMDHYSHLELQMAQWMPLALLGAHRLLRTGRRRYLAVTALAIAAQWYSSMYYALFLSVYVAAFSLVLGIVWREWRRLAYAAVAVLIAAALAFPLARAYSQWQHERGERPRGAIEIFSAIPGDYLQATNRSALYHEVGEGRKAERALFPGIAPMALGIAGAWPPLSATRLALMVSGWAAFDGSLGLNGTWYPLAYDWLFVFRSIRVPARFALLVGLTLALLSGAAVERWRTRAGPRIPTAAWIAALTVIIAVDTWPRIQLVSVWREPPAIYAPLGADSGAVLLEYPIHPNPDWFEENMPFLYFSIWHMTPMVNGYSGTITLRYAQIASSLKGFPGGETIPYLQKLGVTHITVNCAIDGRFEAFGVPSGDPAKCAQTIAQLDADPRLRRIITSSWQGAPALLYEMVR